MQWLGIVTLVMNLVGLVEKLYSDFKGSGAVKKQTVMEMAQAAVGGMQQVSTGGQADTWNAVASVLPTLIDAGVAVMNSVSHMAGGEDVVTAADSFAKASGIASATGGHR